MLWLSKFLKNIWRLYLHGSLKTMWNDCEWKKKSLVAAARVFCLSSSSKCFFDLSIWIFKMGFVHNFTISHIIFEYSTIKHWWTPNHSKWFGMVAKRILACTRNRSVRAPFSLALYRYLVVSVHVFTFQLTWENHNIFPTKNNKFRCYYCVFVLLLRLLFIKCARALKQL